MIWLRASYVSNQLSMHRAFILRCATARFLDVLVISSRECREPSSALRGTTRQTHRFLQRVEEFRRFFSETSSDTLAALRIQIREQSLRRVEPSGSLAAGINQRRGARKLQQCRGSLADAITCTVRVGPSSAAWAYPKTNTSKSTRVLRSATVVPRL